MVKHNHNKKRRSASRKPTKLKQKNNINQRWEKNPKISNAVIREHWDPSKSPSVNMANMGLRARPNDDVHNRSKKFKMTDKTRMAMEGRSDSANATFDSSLTTKVNVIELFDIPDSDQLDQQRKLKKYKYPLKEDDQRYIVQILSTYGDDYGRAFRDIKLNYMQHTESQLRKLASRFLLLSEEQRVVELPKNLQQHL